ncbi:MAG TPA: hypothetical protein VKT80_09250 [Chloroflexota bacterium]|nr:hypothetical protein [Chloroflexota bacterium]
MVSSYRGTGAAEIAWKALAFIRLVNGVLALFAPSWLAGRIGVDPEKQPAVLYVFRMFGIRTILIGADLWLNPAGRARAVSQAVVIHGSDTTAALIAFAFGQLPTRSALTAVAISAFNFSLAVYAVTHKVEND